MLVLAFHCGAHLSLWRSPLIVALASHCAGRLSLWRSPLIGVLTSHCAGRRLIHPGLQPVDSVAREPFNRFNGFIALAAQRNLVIRRETIEMVS